MSSIITAPIEIYSLSGNYLFKVNTRNTKTSSDIFSDVFKGGIESKHCVCSQQKWNVVFTVSSKFYSGAPISDFDHVFVQWIPTIEVALTTENKVHSDYDSCPVKTPNQD